MAVSGANSDLAVSNALNLANRCDPNGDRTIGILTKIDIIDKGTELDTQKILMNEEYILPLGWVGVVNKSRQDNINDISLK